MFYKTKFTLSDREEEYEGYTDGTLWNGWSTPYFTREQVGQFLECDFRFVEDGQLENRRGYPVLLIYLGNGEEDIIESSPLIFQNDEGELDILEVYSFGGWEFMEVE